MIFKNANKGLLYGLLVLFVISFFVTIFTSDLDITPVYSSNFGNTAGNLEVGVLDCVENKSYKSSKYINGENYSGKKYSKSFNCDSKSGNVLNVWVQNNGASEILYSVKDDSKDFEVISLLPGEAITRTFINSTGIQGKFSIEVSAKDESSIEIKASARQYTVS